MNEYAYQIYQFDDRNGFGRYECYCSECGEVVFSMCKPSERKRCPHCGSPFHPNYTMSYKRWQEKRAEQ